MATPIAAEPIPLARLDSPPDEDHAAPAPDTCDPIDANIATAVIAAAAPSANQTSALPAPAPIRRLSRAQSFARGAGFTNSLGTLALIAAVVFGIGAWVGMKIQIGQGGKNMELAIWTACADHEAIQNTSLCKSILAENFSHFEKRQERAIEETRHEKRDVVGDSMPAADSEDITPVATSGEEKPAELSRYEKLLSKLSSTDRAFVHSELDDYVVHEQPHDPAIRATFLPVVNLLIKPIRSAFEFVEYMFLVVIYFVHKIFSWIASIFMFFLQAVIYSWFENTVRYFLSFVDLAILELMPEWLPRFFVSDVASVLCLTALRSYWYSASYLNSLKWIIILRVCIWAVFFSFFTIVPLLWKIWQSGGEALQDRKSSLSSPSFAKPPTWFRPQAAEPAISSGFSSSNNPPRQHNRSGAPTAPLAHKPPLRVGQKSDKEMSAEDLFYQSLGQPKSRG